MAEFSEYLVMDEDEETAVGDTLAEVEEILLKDLDENGADDDFEAGIYKLVKVVRYSKPAKG